MKRVFLIIAGIFGLLGLLVALLVIWQPATLKARVFNYAATRLSEAIPYDVKVGPASGNLFTAVTFQDVWLFKKHSSEVLLHFQKVTVGFHWAAFVTQRRVGMNRLEMRLGDGRAMLKGPLELTHGLSAPIRIEDQDFPLQKLFVVAGSIEPPFPLTHTGHWTIQIASPTVTVKMEGRLNGSPTTLQGEWMEPGSYRGEWTWAGVSLRPYVKNLMLRSQVASVHLQLAGKGLQMTGEAHWRSALAEANVKLVNGIGTYQARVGPDHFQSHVQGRINLLQRSIQGTGTVVQGTWGDAALEKLEFQFSASAEHQTLDLLSGQLQLKKDVPQPTDIASAHLTFDGSSPRWTSTAALKLRNGDSMETSGVLRQEPGSWQFVWDRLAFVFPMTGTWTATHSGSISWAAPRHVEIRDVFLADGAQTLEIPQALINPGEMRLDMTAKNLDPAPWLKLFAPAVTLDGTLNTALQINRNASGLHVNGFVNGHFPVLTVAALGMSVKEIDLQLKCTDQGVEVVHFSGKTKKGDVQITGGSQLPQLDYALHAQKLILEPYPRSHGTVDVALALTGTVGAPILTGDVRVEEATYTVPKKEKKKKPEASVAVSSPTVTPPVPALAAGRLDVRMEWPRNVWYRDGISSIETQGDIRIQKPEQSSRIILTGTITSLQGSYNYYGRNFNLVSGQIRFTGTPEINPDLNVEASYTSGPTTVYLDITGTTQKPELKMHSNPPLPENDIVSVIVFGQPLNELRSRTGASTNNQQMMQAASGVLGNYLAQGLNQTGIAALNFDVIDIQPADQTGGNQFTLGRYLTRRLFISYGATVQGTAEKTVEADYYLTDKWTLHGASDSLLGEYMDFLFRYPLNNTRSAGSTAPVHSSPFRNSLDQPNYQEQFRTPLQ